MMSKILIYVLCFILFYNPPLVQINSVVLGGAISYLYILVNFKSIDKIFSGKRLIIWISFFGILTYLFMMMLILRSPLSNISFLIYIVFFSFPIIATLLSLGIKNKYTLKDWLEIFLWTGLIQSVIAILALIFPNFQQILINRIVSLGYSEIWLELTNIRLFGFSDSLTFATPVIQAALSIVSLFMAFEYDKKYFFFVPFLMLSSIINARTSFVVLIIGILMLIISYSKNNKQIIRLVLILIGGAIVIVGFNKVISSIFPDVYQWLSTGVEEIIGFFSGNVEEGYFSYLFDKNNYPLPDNILFGEGTRALKGISISSDIGYINDLWLGGLIYLVIMYSLTLYNTIILYKNKYNNFYSFFAVFYLATVIFINFKGVAFGTSGLNYLFLLILFFSMLNSTPND